MSPYMRDFLQNNQRFFTLLHVERPKSSNMKSARHGISIHSPLTGRDRLSRNCTTRANNFNPLSPHGERLSNSHQGFRKPRYFNPLSPHGERPAARKTAGNRRNHFNPLSPHGERQKYNQSPPRPTYFNPLSPHGERLVMV